MQNGIRNEIRILLRGILPVGVFDLRIVFQRHERGKLVVLLGRQRVQTLRELRLRRTMRLPRGTNGGRQRRLQSGLRLHEQRGMRQLDKRLHVLHKRRRRMLQLLVVRERVRSEKRLLLRDGLPVGVFDLRIVFQRYESGGFLLLFRHKRVQVLHQLRRG